MDSRLKDRRRRQSNHSIDRRNRPVPRLYIHVTHSAEAAPRLPVLKFSMERTVFFSSGTEVPPEVTSTMGRFLLMKPCANSRMLCASVWGRVGRACVCEEG